MVVSIRLSCYWGWGWNGNGGRGDERGVNKMVTEGKWNKMVKDWTKGKLNPCGGDKGKRYPKPPNPHNYLSVMTRMIK